MHRVKDDFASAFDYIWAPFFQHVDQIEAILSHQASPLSHLARQKRSTVA